MTYAHVPDDRISLDLLFPKLNFGGKDSYRYRVQLFNTHDPYYLYLEGILTFLIESRVQCNIDFNKRWNSLLFEF